MHCPNCRQHNASTTRFCTACGAVLVESTPQGGRRRVLRPWGLRRSAPLTESPAMPELVAAHRAAQRAATPPRRRVDVVLVCGVAFVGAAGVVAYPFSGSEEAAVARAQERVQVREQVVTIPALATVRETQLAAPALIDVPVTPSRRPAAAKPVTTSGDPTPRAPTPARASDAIPETPSSAPPAEPPVLAVRVDPPRAAPTPAVDRWQPLRDSLAGCGSADGLLQRAMCEQRARLAHCDGQWGEVTLCPAGRTEYGQ